MFGIKKNSTSVQISIKEKLISNLDRHIYDINKKNFGNDEDNELIRFSVGQLKIARNRLEDSVGMAKSDISVGVQKAEKAISELDTALKGTYIGRIQDAIDALIDNLDEIVDYENGDIDFINPVDTEESKVSKKLTMGFNQIQELESELNDNRSRIEKDIKTYERDKKELDHKIATEKNDRIALNLFKEMKSLKKNITLLSERGSYYSSCYELINAIKVYVNELMQSASMSTISLDRIKFITRIRELKSVVDDPKKLKQILILIKDDMDKSRENAKFIDSALDKTFAVPEADLSELSEYRNSLLADDQRDAAYEDTMSELEQYRKELEKEN